MLIFKGMRKPLAEQNTVIFTTDGERWANLPLYLDEVNHSPTGFEWGYWGSGPAQLAYAILRTYFRVVRGEDTQDSARMLYQRFKQNTIGAIQTDEWEMSQDDVAFWIDDKLEEL